MGRVHKHSPPPLTLTKALQDGKVTNAEAKRVVSTLKQDPKATRHEQRKLEQQILNHIDSFQPAGERAISRVVGGAKPLTMTAALRDGKVTDAESRRIEQTYDNRRQTTAADRSRLGAFYESHVDAFDVGSQKRLSTFLHSQEPTLAMPGATTTADGNVTALPTQHAYGSLFVNGVSDSDIEQGQLGDCYFLSAVNSLAHQDPKQIENMFHANNDGTVTVTLYGSTTPGGPLQKIPITIDRQLPVYGNGVAGYAASRDPHELWPAMLEKAYAQLCTQYPCNETWDVGQSGYNAIGEGGYSAIAYRTLTGQSGVDQSTAGDPEQLWATLSSRSAQRQPTVTASNQTVANGLVGDHEYAIYGTVEQNGQRFVQLHNPWGNTEPGNDGNNDGTFLLPYDQFLQNFNTVTTLG